MRLIDADTLIKKIKRAKKAVKLGPMDIYAKGTLTGLDYAIYLINNVTTVEERKHGHWFDPEDDDGRTAWHCSVCDYVVKTIGFYPNYNYCPCCGARMDEEVQK